jgi:hypothetical protein
MARGDWTRRNIADERSRDAAREELAHGFRGAMSDDDMVRYAEALDIAYGPPPEDGWATYEPNTYGGS